jgi:signal transduction histidine kinase
VAIENARLYTLTDQALAARVEELSVMQRIDRELNASLEIERAMRISLEWSMRQSKADAGLAGILNGAGVQVIASQGYPADLDSANNHLALDFPALKEAIQTGRPSHSHLAGSLPEAGQPELPGSQAAGNGTGLLANARGQVVVPIRRETRVIGVILLESAAAGFPEEMLDFLSRLSDHAAIAISNAQLYEAIQAANLTKSQFVSSAAHELKNPLTSIKGYSDLLVAGAVGPVSEGQAHFLATIRSNAERMSTLVSDLQDISRIEAGQLRLQFSPVPLPAITGEVLRSLGKQIEDKEQNLDISVPENMPPLWGDVTRLVQILTNLVSNAHKYTPRAGLIAIRAELVRNRWDAQGAPEVIHVTVQDNGIGIDPEDQKKLFLQFFRSEDPRVREVTGTGLGLSITKNLVEMQGGRIWFESVYQQGTSFHFTIPAAETG